MYLLVIFLPLLGSIFSSIVGRFLGFRGSIIITTFCVMISFFLSLIIFYEVAWAGSQCTIELSPWFFSEMFDASWGFYFDSLTSIMLIVVTSISSLVHIYSISYMEKDPHIPRFMSYLSIFTFFMLMLITADNFIQMFFGWEGVGLASYLLINFWFTRLQASKASIKAMLINRIGDFGLALGIMGLFTLFKSVNFSTIFALAYTQSKSQIIFCNFELNSLNLICILLFIGAIGKSAQLGLHTWLPDAMEGPTPVSALIHAATMVTAGVFMLTRCSPLFEYAPTSLLLVTFIGAMTCFFAATTGLVQNDLKRVIAYSTCSQLGYMVFACGISNYSVGVFHLMNHAFFKALLFLSAGSVIHALSDEQDMRKMGGILQLLPFTYAMMFIGSLSLVGFPFLTGFYSKDVIIELAFAKYTFSSHFAYFLGLICVFFTSYYSFRLLILTFINSTKSYKLSLKNIHEAPVLMAVPLVLLAFGSIFVGYLFKDMMIGSGTNFWSNSIFILPKNVILIESEYIPQFFKYLTFILIFFGFFIAFSINFLNISAEFFFEILKKLKIQNIKNFAKQSYSLEKKFKFISNKNSFYKILHSSLIHDFYLMLNKRWFFDKLYNKSFAQNALNFGYKTSFKLLDKGFFEILGPFGISKTIQELSRYFTKLQTGIIYHYAVIMLVGLTLLISLVSLWDFLSIIMDNRLYFIYFISFLFYNYFYNQKYKHDL